LGTPFPRLEEGKLRLKVSAKRRDRGCAGRKKKQEEGRGGLFIALAWSQRTCPLIRGLVRYTGHVRYLADLSAWHLLERIKGWRRLT